MIDSVSIKRPARLEYVHECLILLIEYARSHGFASHDMHNVRIIAEEVLANIISHAYENDPGDIDILCRPRSEYPGGDSLLIEFKDSGIPFKFKAPEPDLSADVAERPIGGLGMYLIKSLAEDVRYRRERGQNILTVTIRKTDSGT